MKYRILIVEDDPVIAGAVKRQIEAWGCEARPRGRTLPT